MTQNARKPLGRIHQAVQPRGKEASGKRSNCVIDHKPDAGGSQTGRQGAEFGDGLEPEISRPDVGQRCLTKINRTKNTEP